jgi:hypothetical protein
LEVNRLAQREEERRQFALLLQRVANEEALMKGVHPGYRACCGSTSNIFGGGNEF